MAYCPGACQLNNRDDCFDFGCYVFNFQKKEKRHDYSICLNKRMIHSSDPLIGCYVNCVYGLGRGEKYSKTHSRLLHLHTLQWRKGGCSEGCHGDNVNSSICHGYLCQPFGGESVSCCLSFQLSSLGLHLSLSLSLSRSVSLYLKSSLTPIPQNQHQRQIQHTFSQHHVLTLTDCPSALSPFSEGFYGLSHCYSTISPAPLPQSPITSALASTSRSSGGGVCRGE